MSQPSLLSNPMGDWFDYVYKYWFHPVLNLQHAFSPTINFGRNAEDAPAEQHVLDSVGSYGYQLNRVLDALAVLIEHPQLKQLSPDDEKKIADFKKLAREADEAAREYRGQATQAGVARIIEGMRALKQADPELYHRLREQLLAGI